MNVTALDLLLLLVDVVDGMYFRLVHGGGGKGGEDSGKKPTIGTFVNLLLGFFTEWEPLPITLHIECLTTQIQTTPSGSNLLSYTIMCRMLSDPQCLRRMYNGIDDYVVLLLKTSIQYKVYERIKDVLITSRKREKHGRIGGSDGVLTVKNHPDPRVLTSNQKGQNYCFGITQQYYEVYSTLLFFLKFVFVIGFSTGLYLRHYH